MCRRAQAGNILAVEWRGEIDGPKRGTSKLKQGGCHQIFGVHKWQDAMSQRTPVSHVGGPMEEDAGKMMHVPMVHWMIIGSTAMMERRCLNA